MRGAVFATALGIAACWTVTSSAGAQGPPTVVKDINEQLAIYGVQPEEIVDVGGTAFFRGCADDGTTGCELWKSDGTTAGTILVKDIVPGSGRSDPGYLTNVNDTLFFRACSEENPSGPEYGPGDCELWKSDGTEAGTLRVKDIVLGNESSNPSELINMSGTLFFVAYDRTSYGLWKSDGTEEGTVLVKDILPGSGGSFFDYSSHLTNVNGTLFFAADDGVNGAELWKSDGTEAGTVRVKDILPGSESSNPSELLTMSEALFFLAYDGTTRGLWKSDGTEAGTVFVKGVDIRYELANVGETLFFTDYDGTSYGLWKSDGTEVGTVLVQTLHKEGYWNPPRFLTNVGGTLFFAYYDADGTYGLWRSDGTAAGTFLALEDSPPGTRSSSPESLTNVNGKLFFTSGSDLWKSDGTEAGTGLLGYGFRILANANGTLFLNSLYWPHGRELWKSDGTEAGTVFVAEIPEFEGSGSSGLSSPTSVGGMLFLLSCISYYATTCELWKSDGTEAGTVAVDEDLILVPPWEPGADAPLVGVNGTLFFVGHDEVHGDELWKSNGTAAGTVLVKDIRPGTGSASLAELTDGNGTLFFQANDGASGEELWQSDGTEAGTVLVADLIPGSGGSVPEELTVAGSSLFFSAIGEGIGRELWMLPIPEPDASLLGVASVGVLAVVARRSACGSTHRKRRT
jgi:ELWxxDGT repeat protein